MSLVDQAKAMRNDVDEIIDGIYESFDEDNEQANKEVALEIYAAIDAMDKGWLPTPEHIAKVAVATCKNVQVRDFLMGLHTEKDADTVGAYLEVLLLSVQKKYSYAVVTVLSTYTYISGEKDTAIQIVKEVLKSNPDYSLARLLDRIFPVFSGDNMKSMAQELHPKVKETLGLN